MDFSAPHPVLLTVWYLPLFPAMVPIIPFCTLDPSLGKPHCLVCSWSYWGICLLQTFAPSVQFPLVPSRVSGLPPCESANLHAIAFMKQSSSVSSFQSLSRVQLFATPWTAARQASLPITNSRSLLKLMSIESVMPSNHLILCHSLLLPSIFPSIRVFSNESVLHIR